MELRYIPERALFLSKIEGTEELEVYLLQSGKIKVVPASEFFEVQENQDVKDILEFLLLAITDR